MLRSAHRSVNIPMVHCCYTQLYWNMLICLHIVHHIPEAWSWKSLSLFKLPSSPATRDYLNCSKDHEVAVREMVWKPAVYLNQLMQKLEKAPANEVCYSWPYAGNTSMVWNTSLPVYRLWILTAGSILNQDRSNLTVDQHFQWQNMDVK